MKKIISFILVFLILINSALALEGYIYDSSTKESIPYATIKAEGTNIGTMTRIDGKYILNLPSKTYTLTASHVAYNKLSQLSTSPNFYLEQKPIFAGETKVIEKSICRGQIYGYIFDSENKKITKDVEVKARYESASNSILSELSGKSNKNIILTELKRNADENSWLWADTSSNGYYTLPFLPSGKYTIIATVNGITAVSDIINFECRESSIESNIRFNQKIEETPKQNEQIIPVGDVCSGDYNILLLENGALLTSQYLWSKEIYQKNSYLFIEPSSNLAILNGRAKIMLYKNNLQNKCGEKIIQVVNGKCTNYVFNLKDKGSITFQICPETTQDITIGKSILIPECKENKDCKDSSKPFCYFGECISEDFNNLQCLDLNENNKITPVEISTDLSFMIPNPEQKLGGGTCSSNNIEKKDYCKDSSTLVYFTCEDNCLQGKEYNCNCINNRCASKVPDSNKTRISLSESELIEATLCNGFEYNNEWIEFNPATLPKGSIKEIGTKNGERLYEVNPRRVETQIEHQEGDKAGIGAAYEIEAVNSKLDSLFNLGTTVSGVSEYAYGVRVSKSEMDLSGDGVPDQFTTREFSSDPSDKNRKYNIRLSVADFDMSSPAGDKTAGLTSSVNIVALFRDSDLEFVFTDNNGNGIIDGKDTAVLVNSKKQKDGIGYKIRDATQEDFISVFQDINAQMEARKQRYQEEIKKKEN